LSQERSARYSQEIWSNSGFVVIVVVGVVVVVVVVVFVVAVVIVARRSGPIQVLFSRQLLSAVFLSHEDGA